MAKNPLEFLNPATGFEEDEDNPLSFLQPAVGLDEEEEEEENPLSFLKPATALAEENPLEFLKPAAEVTEEPTPEDRVFPTEHPLVRNPDGSTSNVVLGTFTFGEGDDLESIVIPTMVGGKQLTDDEAVGIAREHGLDKYPSFASMEEANAWAEEHHGRITEEGKLAVEEEENPLAKLTGITRPKTFNEKVEFVTTTFGPVAQARPDPNSLLGQSGRTFAAGLPSMPLKSGAGTMQQLADVGEITHDAISKFMSGWEKNRMRAQGFTEQYTDFEHIDKKYETSKEYLDDLRDTADTWRTAAHKISEDYGVDPEFAQSFLGQVMTGAGEAPGYILSAMAGPAGWVPLIGSGYEEATSDYMQLIKEQGKEYDVYDNFRYAMPYSIVSGVMERMGVEAAISKLIPKGSKLAFVDIVKKLGTGALAEGVTESAQGFVQDAIAAMTVDDERTLFTPEDLMNRLREFGVGFFVGGGTTTAVQGAAAASAVSRDPNLLKEFADENFNMTDTALANMYDEQFTPEEEAEIMRQLDETEIGEVIKQKAVVGRTVNKGKKEGPPLHFAHWERNKEGNLVLDDYGNPIPIYNMEQPFPEMGYSIASPSIPVTLSAQDFEKSGFQFTFPDPPSAEAAKLEEAVRRRNQIRNLLTTTPEEQLPEVQALMDHRTQIMEDAEERFKQSILDKPVTAGELLQPLVRKEILDNLESEIDIDVETEEGRAEAKISEEGFQTLMQEAESEASIIIESDQILEEIEASEELDEEQLAGLRTEYRAMLTSVLDGKNLARMKFARKKKKLKPKGIKLTKEERLQKKLDNAERQLIRLSNEKDAALAEVREKRDAQIAELKMNAENKLERQKAKAKEKLALLGRRRVEDINRKYQQRKDITEAIKSLEKMIRELPTEIQHRIKGFGSLAKIIGKPKQDEFLYDRMRRINEVLDDYTVRSNQEALGNMIKRVRKNKKKAKELAIFDRINEYAEMSVEDAHAIAENLLKSHDPDDPTARREALTADELETVFLAKMFGGKLNTKETVGFRGKEMKQAMDEAEYILREGKSKVADRVAQRDARNDAMRAETIRAILPEELKGIKFIKLREQDKTRFRKVLQGLDQYLNVNQDGFEMLLDNLRYRGERFTGFMHNTFFRPVAQAQTRTETRNRMALKRFSLIMQRALALNGVVPSKKAILETSQAWGVQVPNTGIRYKHQSDKVEEIPMSKWEAITMWMQWQDKSLEESFEKMGVDEEVMSNVEQFIKRDGRMVGLYLLNEYKRFGSELRQTVANNDNYIIEIHDNYSPISRYVNGNLEKTTQELTNMQDWRSGDEKNRSLIQRVHNTNELGFHPAHEVFSQHAYQMNHYFEFAAIANDLRAVFNNDEVRRAIRQRTGGTKYQRNLDNIIDNILRGGIERAKFEEYANWIVKRTTVGSLALRLPVFFKQLGSFPGYAAAMPFDEWVKYEKDFFKNFGDNVKTILDTEYIQNRISGSYDRDLKMAAQQTTEQGLANMRTQLDKMMFLTRLGDVGAIAIGGWSLYQYTYDQTYNKLIDKNVDKEEAKILAREEAEMKFAEVTARQQQDSNLYSLGYYQQLGSYAKMFTMFMTTPIQYHRNTFSALKAYFQKDPETGERRMSFQDMAKNVFIFHVLLPQIYTAIGSAFIGLWGDDDDEVSEFWERQLMALGVGNLNAAFITGEVIQGIIETLWNRDNEFKLRSSLPVLDKFNNFGEGLVDAVYGMREGDLEEFAEGADKAIEEVMTAIGVPYGAVMDFVKGGWDVVTGEGDAQYRIARLMGWSDYQIPGEDPNE